MSRVRPLAPPATVRRRPELWSSMAVLTFGLSLLGGLGAYQEIYLVKPTRYTIAMTTLFVLTIALTPRGLLRKVRFVRPLTLLIAWMVMSYAWTNYHGGFVKITAVDLITIISIVVLGQLFTFDRFLRVVLGTGYVAIGLILVAAVAMHSRAFTDQGLRGGFIHKSPMGAALVLTVCASLALGGSKRSRRALIAIVIVLLLLGRTTTGLASILLVLALYVPLTRHQEWRKKLGRSFGIFMTAAVVGFGALYYALSNVLVSASGKDLTFSNRTVIWKGVVHAISQRPLTGYGWSVWLALWLQPAQGVIRTTGFAVSESHNSALELLFRLGVVGLVLYLWLLVKALRGGLSLTSIGDRSGIFAVLLVATILIWGFSESLAMTGAWIGLLGVVAVPRPVPLLDGEQLTEPRRRLLAPRSRHVGVAGAPASAEGRPA